MRRLTLQIAKVSIPLNYFSDDQTYQADDTVETNETNNNDSEHLFDQDINEEEDFEIPAFLRKQKF